jgi:hypothetical protein
VWLSVALSYSGPRALRLPPASRDGFPAEFRAGIVIDRAGARLASQLGCT